MNPMSVFSVKGSFVLKNIQTLPFSLYTMYIVQFVSCEHFTKYANSRGSITFKEGMKHCTFFPKKTFSNTGDSSPSIRLRDSGNDAGRK